MLDMPNGQTVATAVIGHEAGVTMLSVLEPSPLSRYGGRTRGREGRLADFRITIFTKPLTQSGAIRHAVQTHARALLMAQFQSCGRLQCAALRRKPRMAQWLFCHIHDRI